MGSVAAKQKSETGLRAGYSREDYHSGSWYEDDADALDKTLLGFLDRAAVATVPQQGPVNGSINADGRLRALIVPHAGFSYSGPTAAYAYQALRQELSQASCPIQTIVVLHPSHHVYLDGCAVSGATVLETPLMRLRVNDTLRQEILQLGASSNRKNRFSIMTKKDDENEHSGEMQYPFLAKVLQDTDRQDVTVLPIMCGALNERQEEFFGKQLSEILARPEIVTVVSSDFCHWGSRFRYRPVGEGIPIHKFIERMDRRGMDLIELQQPGAFAEYLRETQNTICGRHAVAVWLRAVVAADSSEQRVDVDFCRYDQSSQVQTMHESSVSYAAAVARSSRDLSLPN